MIYFTMYMVGAFATHCWLHHVAGERLKEEGLIIASVIAAFVWPYTLLAICFPKLRVK